MSGPGVEAQAWEEPPEKPTRGAVAMLVIGGITLAAAVGLVIADITSATRNTEGCHGCLPYSTFIPIPLAIGVPLVAVGGVRLKRQRDAQMRVTLGPGRLTLAF